MAPFLLVEEIEPDLLEHYGALGGQTVLVYTQPIHRTEAFDMPLLRIEYAPNAAGSPRSAPTRGTRGPGPRRSWAGT